MRAATKAFLGLVFGIVQIGWLFLWVLIFTLMGYDGGGFAGGAVSPLTGLIIMTLPLIIAGVAWTALKALSTANKIP